MHDIEITTFIETMEEFGDVWTPEQVKDVYGNRSLDEALADRKASLADFADALTKAIKK